MLAPKEVSHLFELYLKAKPPHIGQKSWSEKKIVSKKCCNWAKLRDFYHI